jgi:hypothetical protein
MLSFNKALAFFATTLVCSMADPIREPARLRLNADLLKTVFHSGDQRILDVFTDLQLQPEAQLEELTGSLMTVEGVDAETYDFDLYLNDPDKQFLGFGG